MRTIYKYTMTTTPDCFIELPIGAEFLDCQQQGTEIVFWFIVDTESRTTKRLFTLAMTGQQIRHSKSQHLKTIQFSDGIVGHIFEV